MQCKKCGKEIKENRFFCSSCGEYSGNIQNNEIAVSYQDRLIKHIKAAKECTHTSIERDDELDKSIRKLEMTRALIPALEIDEKIKERLIKKIDNYIEQCVSSEFQIAFVGTIKAGKSTLINALLGHNYASTDVTPETAVLTKFCHSKTENYVRITFYNAAEWEQLWNSISTRADVFMQEYNALNAESAKDEWIGHSTIEKTVDDNNVIDEIEKWTSSKKVAHYFVKEVTVGLTEIDIPDGVVFVDTPGLDDAVAYRSDVTRHYIANANAVFACIKSDALTGAELKTLYAIFANTAYNPGKVFVIGTKWDNLNNPVDDWKKQREEWLKYLEKSYESKKLAEENITYAAANLQNIARDYHTATESEKLTLMSAALKFRIMPANIENHISDIMELSNISTVQRKLKSDFDVV